MKTKNNNIVLTGFRATGKSTVGRIIARKLGYPFIDTDAEICHQLGATIADMVAQYGWPYFRQAEAKLLRELCSLSNWVVATGGGAIEHHDEWRSLRRVSFVVWLDADITTITQRISSDPASVRQRPDLGLEKSSFQDETAMLLHRRIPLYAAGSDLRLDTGAYTPDELAATLHETLRAVREKCDLGTFGEKIPVGMD